MVYAADLKSVLNWVPVRIRVGALALGRGSNPLHTVVCWCRHGLAQCKSPFMNM